MRHTPLERSPERDIAIRRSLASQALWLPVAAKGID